MVKRRTIKEFGITHGIVQIDVDRLVWPWVSTLHCPRNQENIYHQANKDQTDKHLKRKHVSFPNSCLEDR